MHRRLGSAVLVLVLIAAVLGCGGHRGVQFDSAVWKRPVRYCAPSPRMGMVHSAASVVESARGPAGVRQKLGAPDSVAEGDWYYMVGANDAGLLPECVALRVHFGGESPVATIETDS